MSMADKQALWEAVEAIRPEYVEAAVYPSAKAGKNVLGEAKVWKRVAAAAAALVIGFTCVRFAPRAMAFAEKILTGVFEMDGDASTMEGTMEKIHINDDLTFIHEDEEMFFHDIREVEKYLGVTLLHSKRATKKDTSDVNMSVVHRGELITVTDDAYYLFREKPDDEGNYVSVGDEAYCISYQATFLTNRSTSDGYIHSYADAKMVETYTTKNGIQAGIFVNSEIYRAVLYRDGIQYVFAFTPWRDEPGERQASDLTNFKAFLDTLK